MSVDRRTGSRIVTRGAIAGACAYLLGYLVTYVWKAQAVNDAVRGINVLAEIFGARAIPTWKAVGWLFYGEHFVSTRIPTIGGDAMVNLVGRGDGMDALYLVPPVVLLLAGALVARAGETGVDTGRTAIRGGAIVAGYLPLAVLGVFATSHEIGGTGRTIVPDLVTAVVLAGVVFPVALGGIGGVLASRL